VAVRWQSAFRHGLQVMDDRVAKTQRRASNIKKTRATDKSQV